MPGKADKHRKKENSRNWVFHNSDYFSNFPDAGSYIKSGGGCQAQIRRAAIFYSILQGRQTPGRIVAGSRFSPEFFCFTEALRRSGHAGRGAPCRGTAPPGVTHSAARCRRCTGRWCGRRRTSRPWRCWSAPSCSMRGRRPWRRAPRPWRGSSRENRGRS